MPNLSRRQIAEQLATLLHDNTSGDISAQDVRDSFALVVNNVPEFHGSFASIEVGTRIEPGDTCLTDGGLFYAETDYVTAADDLIPELNPNWRAPQNTRPGYLFYAQPALTTPMIPTLPAKLPTTGLEATILDEYEVPGPVFPGIVFTTEWRGLLDIEVQDIGAGPRELQGQMITEHAFGPNFSKRLSHTRTLTCEIKNDAGLCLNFNDFNSWSTLSTGAYRPPGGNVDGTDDIQITAEDFAGPSRITYKLRLQVIRDAQRDPVTFTLNRARLPVGIATRSFQIAHGEGAPTLPVANRPSITRFTLAQGNLDPAPGSIAGNAYNFDYSVGQPDDAGAVRVIGFKGAFEAANAVVLSEIARDHFAQGHGTVTIPAGTSLAVGESYTLRLQAFARGVTEPAIGTQPAAYSDIVIRAAAPATTNYRWGRIIRNTDDATAAATANRIVFADDDLQTGVLLARSYAATPPAAGTDEYQFYLAVRDGSVEPVGWNSAGLAADAAFQAPVTRTISDVRWEFWILRPELARMSVDGAINYEPRTA
ncbi:MAG: hypothetical protein OXL41_03990 [Nitrospinae bacterium]|nr:hypothetical protein [Nitrospinota bacterium]